MPDATEKIQLTWVNGSDTQLLHAPLPGPVSLTKTWKSKKATAIDENLSVISGIEVAKEKV
jgi:hypothetical protein